MSPSEKKTQFFYEVYEVDRYTSFETQPARRSQQRNSVQYYAMELDTISHHTIQYKGSALWGPGLPVITRSQMKKLPPSDYD